MYCLFFMPLKYILLTVFSATLFKNNLFAQELQWLRQGGNDKTKARCVQITTDGRGSVFALLEVNGTFKIQNKIFKGGEYALVLALGENGLLKWGIPIEVSGGKVKSSFIAYDGYESLWIGGHFQGSLSAKNKSLNAGSSNSVFYIKISTAGDVMTAGSTPIFKEYASVQGHCDGLGRLTLAGDFYTSSKWGTIEHQYPSKNALFITRIDMKGDVIWSKAYPSEGLVQVSALKAQPDGTVVIAGQFNQMLDIANDTPFQTQLDAAPFIIRFDYEGNILWYQALEVPMSSKNLCLALDAKADIYFMCSYKGQAVVEQTIIHSTGHSSDILLCKYTGKGQLQWYKSIGGKGADYGMSVAVDSRFRVYASGYGAVDSTFLGNIADLSGREQDAFIISFDAAGQQLWTERARGSGVEKISSLHLEGENHLFFGGNFESKQIKLGGFGANRLGDEDIIIGLMQTDRFKKPDYARHVSVFPNPSKAIIYYSVSKGFPGKQITVSIQKKNEPPIYQEKVLLKQSFAKSFNMANQLPGVYYLHVVSDKAQVTQRLIIE